MTFEEGSWAASLYDLLKPHVTKIVVCNSHRNAYLKRRQRFTAAEIQLLSPSSVGHGCRTAPPATTKPWRVSARSGVHAAMHKVKITLDTGLVKHYSWIDAAVQHTWRCNMQASTRTAPARTHPGGSSFVSVLSGWAQQGVQSLFATQRILVDLAMRQNANVAHALRQQLTDPHHSPTAILNEVAGEGMTNFIEGQKILLDLGKKQNEILMTGVKERIGDWPEAHAMTDLLRRSVETFIHMQQEFLKVADKQTHSWVEAAKAGKPYESEHLVALAREGMENFVKAQKQFLDIIAEETAKASGGKRTNGVVKKIKKTELSELARQATEPFIDAQKKLVDVAGKQMNATVKTAGNALELLRSLPFKPLAELTREGVKSYVDAQKALMDVVVKPVGEHKHPGRPVRRGRKPGTRTRKQAAAAAA